MQFIDLKSQYAMLKSAIDARIQRVLDHGQYILGPEVAELEGRLAEFAGTRYCVSCASGTDALMIALMAKGVGSGDAVFVPPFTFFATAEVVALLGATPVFVDIDPVTFNIDPAQLDQAIVAVRARDAGEYPLPRSATGEAVMLRPRGVIAVDLFGQPADYDRIGAPQPRRWSAAEPA